MVLVTLAIGTSASLGPDAPIGPMPSMSRYASPCAGHGSAGACPATVNLAAMTWLSRTGAQKAPFAQSTPLTAKASRSTLTVTSIRRERPVPEPGWLHCGGEASSSSVSTTKAPCPDYPYVNRFTDPNEGFTKDHVSHRYEDFIPSAHCLYSPCA